MGSAGLTGWCRALAQVRERLFGSWAVEPLDVMCSGAGAKAGAAGGGRTPSPRWAPRASPWGGQGSPAPGTLGARRPRAEGRVAGCRRSPGSRRSSGVPGSAPLRGQGDGALPPASGAVPCLVQGPLPWESPLALTNLLRETPTHRTAEGAAVPFTALSPALQKTNERDYLTDTSLLSPSITCGFPSESCRLPERLYSPLSGSCLWAPDRPVPPWLFTGKGPQKSVSWTGLSSHFCRCP